MKEYQRSRWYERAQRKAQRVAKNEAKTRRLLAAATKKAGAHTRGPMAKAWDDLQSLLQLVRAWRSGSYREVPTGSLVLVIATLAYFVSPIDAIPDILPFAGFIDDASLIGWTIHSIRSDLEAFRGWQCTKGDM